MSLVNPGSDRALRDRLPVRVAGRAYEIDLMAMRRVPLESTRIFVDDGAESGERSLDNRGLWRRSQDDASAGEGQQYRDVVELSNRKMFETSRGIDAWERRTMQLLPQAVVNQFVAVGSKLGAIDDGLVLWDGATWTRNLTPPDGIWSAVTGGTTPLSMTAAGTSMFYVDGTNLYRLDSASLAWTLVAATTATRIFYAAGWIIGLKPNRDLVWFDSAGVETVIGTHPWDGFEWTCLTAAPEGIYVGGGDLTSTLGGEIWRVEADDVGGLLPPVVASVLPVGERPESLSYTAGSIAMGTTRGFRLAVVNADESVTYGSLIETPAAVTSLSSYGQFIWFNWSDFPWQEIPNGPFTYTPATGRMDLAEFTASLVPAYASDLMDHDPDEAEDVVGANQSFDLARVNGRLYYLTDKALYQQSDDLVETAELRVGRISFGIFERKAYESVEVRFRPFTTGATIEVLAAYDDEISLQTLGNVGGTTERPGVGVVTFTDPSLEQLEREWVDLRFRLNRDTEEPTNQTVMERWTVRAVPLPYRSEEITLPILLFDVVERDGHDVKMDPYEEFVFLNGLMHSRQMIPLELGKEELRGRVDAVQSDRLGGSEELDRWNRREEFVTGTWEVRFITTQGPIPLALRPTDPTGGGFVGHPH